MKNQEWKEQAPLIAPEEAHINPPHLQRLLYNPDYYKCNMEDLKVGDNVVLGIYASDLHGNPNIKWEETKIEKLPLNHPTIVTIMKRKI